MSFVCVRVCVEDVEDDGHQCDGDGITTWITSVIHARCSVSTGSFCGGVQLHTVGSRTCYCYCTVGIQYMNYFQLSTERWNYRAYGVVWTNLKELHFLKNYILKFRCQTILNQLFFVVPNVRGYWVSQGFLGVMQVGLLEFTWTNLNAILEMLNLK